MRDANAQRAAGLGPMAWVAVTLLITGAMGAVLYIFITGFLSIRQDYARFEAPGEAALDLSTPGTYLVYHEFRRSDDSVGYVRPPGQDEVRFEVIAEGGGNLPVSPSVDKETLAIRRTFSESIAQFQVDAPGHFQIRAVWEPPPDTKPLTLVVRASGREVLWRTVGRGSLVLLLTFVAVVLIGVLGGRRAD